MTIPLKIIKKQEYEKKFGKPEQEKIWNSIAKAWNKYVVKKIPIVEEFLKGKKGRVVDLGCGDGRNMIAIDGIEYYGVDFSEGQLEHAKKYAKKNKIKAEFLKNRIDELDKNVFRDNIFDYGLFIASLHCLESKEERLNALKIFYRILKQGAEALVSVWNSEDKRFKKFIDENSKDIYMNWKENEIDYMRYYYLFSKNEFLDLLKSVGFEILEFYEPREKDRFSKKNWIIKVKK